MNCEISADMMSAGFWKSLRATRVREDCSSWSIRARRNISGTGWDQRAFARAATRELALVSMLSGRRLFGNENWRTATTRALASGCLCGGSLRKEYRSAGLPPPRSPPTQPDSETKRSAEEIFNVFFTLAAPFLALSPFREQSGDLAVFVG